jgi:DNA-binding response OmpR family regulator
MKIILADDSALARLQLTAAIVEGGHEVVAVADGQEAWDEFERSPVPLVVLDWMMPKLDGLEVLRRIRCAPSGADTFVLMATGRGTPTDVASALEAGADDFVVKPITPEHLRARLIIAESRIEARAQEQQLKSALYRAQWLAGIGETVLTLQHEINNPLAVMLVETELLIQEPHMPAQFETQLRSILDQTRRIAEVVQRLSALKQPRSIEPLKGLRMLDLSDIPKRP